MATNVAAPAVVDQPPERERYGAWLAAGVTLAACLSGVLAGFFFAFTNVVAPALGAIDPLLAGGALDAVYVAVRDWPFEVVFFATIAVSLVALAAPLAVRRKGAWRLCVIAASLLVLAGVFVVTGWRIAPAGRILAEAEGGVPPGWRSFLADWRFWNDLRTLAGAAAMLLYLAALAAMPKLWRRGGVARPAAPREPLSARLRARLASSRLGWLWPAGPLRWARATRAARLLEDFRRRFVGPVWGWMTTWFGPLGRALVNRPVVVIAVAVALFAFMAGFFWAFAVVVMPALRALDPVDGLLAIDAINQQVRNIVFALLFFGGIAITRNVAGFALFATPGLVGRLTLLAATIYAAGVLVLTITVMVPLNREIAASLASGGHPGPELASAMLADWAYWNGVRTMAGFAAVATLAVALFLLTGRADRADAARPQK